jgi:arylsulfatase B
MNVPVSVFIAMLLCLLAGLMQAANPPNVVLIITDDQGYGDISAHGNPILKTPNLDRLHAESVRLTNYHVDPTCAPTRSALMTGRYSQRNGTWHTIMGRSLLRRDEVVMPQFFKRTGYSTHMSGKWHLGDNYPYRPEDRGFDSTTVHGGGGVWQAPDAWGNDYFDDRYFVNGELKQFKGYCTDVFFDAAMAFIKQNRNKPFFCYLATNAPHSPYWVDDKYKQMYQDKTSRAPQAAFYGMIANIDENIGRLRAFLKEQGLAENTILIFTTDNGTSAGWSAGMRGQKGSEYEGGHRVPFFIHWPEGGFNTGRDIDTLTAHLDILPTLAEYCGLDISTIKLDGQSLRPLIDGASEDWPDRHIITESQRMLHPEKWRKSSVMTQQWRLVNGTELYDIQKDPAQEHDVAGQHPEVVEQLRASYERFWDDVGERRDIISYIVVGNDAENPVQLCSHDWFGEGSQRGWNQGQIAKGFDVNGAWNIDVEQAGDYDITLRRWPTDAEGTITGPSVKYFQGGTEIKADTARLKVADVDERKPIQAEDTGITFRVTLKQGQTTLQTWFLDGDNDQRGAYYVYVERISN